MRVWWKKREERMRSGMTDVFDAFRDVSAVSKREAGRLSVSMAGEV